MVPWQSSATCEARTGSGFLRRQLVGSRLGTLAPGTILAGGGGVAATLSGGEAGAILLIVIVRVLATGGQVLAQALLSCADNWLEADSARSHLEHSSQVEVEWQPCCQARPSRSCSKLSLSVRQQREEKILVSFVRCRTALPRGWSTTLWPVMGRLGTAQGAPALCWRIKSA